jgi:hypothetical protein
MNGRHPLLFPGGRPEDIQLQIEVTTRAEHDILLDGYAGVCGLWSLSRR